MAISGFSVERTDLITSIVFMQLGELLLQCKSVNWAILKYPSLSNLSWILFFWANNVVAQKRTIDIRMYFFREFLYCIFYDVF